MNKKLIIFNYILLVISILVYGEYLINFATYSFAYVLFILFFILLALHTFITGIIVNNNKGYKNNIRIYYFLYIILLISLTIFVKRPEFALFDSNFLSIYVDNINIIPFRSIISLIGDNIGLGTKLYNIIGNLVCLMPLVFLLIITDKKYDKVKNQLKILLITVVGIEVLQFFLSAGRLDIDEIILNIGGALLFFLIFKKLKLTDEVRNVFNSDLTIANKLKYTILVLVSLAIVVMDVLFIIDLNSDIVTDKERFVVLSRDDCANDYAIEMADYKVYIDCLDVRFVNDKEVLIPLDEAFLKHEIKKSDLKEYFGIIEYLENVTIYRSDNLTMFVCDSDDNKNIYVGNANRSYNNECG